MPRSRSNGRRPRPAPVAAETRMQKAKRLAAAAANNGYVQYATATLGTSGIMLATGHADVTALQAVGTTVLSAVAVGVVAGVAKTAKAAYDNASIEGVKAGYAKAKSATGTGLSYAVSPFTWAYGKAKALVVAPAADVPARRPSRGPRRAK